MYGPHYTMLYYPTLHYTKLQCTSPLGVYGLWPGFGEQVLPTQGKNQAKKSLTNHDLNSSETQQIFILIFYKA